MHMDTRIKFLYLSEPDMIKAGVKNMDQCVEAMEDLLVTLNKGDYVMAGVNHNSHGAQVIFPDDPQFEGMPKNADDRRFMAMPAYLGGKYQMAGMKWYGSNCENKASGLPRSILMMMLNDKDTGAPLALMSANLVSCYRTGAIPGVGAKYLARKDSECYGEDPYLNTVFGVASVKGYQGEKLSDPYSIAACLKHYVGYGVSEGGR